MEKSFKQSVIEGLKYYVYALVDPRDNRIFYVGKGTGNRVSFCSTMKRLWCWLTV